ncbi:MAG: metallophosphoesterase family protein [Nanoarchaeota archaeon]
MKKDTNKKKLRILAAGDLHGNSAISEMLAKKAKENDVDLVILLGDIHGMNNSDNLIGPFKKANKKVIFVPGNWDSTFESNMIEAVYGIKNINGKYVIYEDTGIIGIGNPDFQLYLEEESVFLKLKSNFEKVKTKNKILVSHLHAYGTKTEFSGFQGSLALRKAIDNFQPDFFLSAHIHEAEGIEEKIGKTKLISVGKKGRIIEI